MCATNWMPFNFNFSFIITADETQVRVMLYIFKSENNHHKWRLIACMRRVLLRAHGLLSMSILIGSVLAGSWWISTYMLRNMVVAMLLMRILWNYLPKDWEFEYVLRSRLRHHYKFMQTEWSSFDDTDDQLWSIISNFQFIYYYFYYIFMHWTEWRRAINLKSSTLRRIQMKWIEFVCNLWHTILKILVSSHDSVA